MHQDEQLPLLEFALEIDLVTLNADRRNATLYSCVRETQNEGAGVATSLISRYVLWIYFEVSGCKLRNSNASHMLSCIRTYGACNC